MSLVLFTMIFSFFLEALVSNFIPMNTDLFVPCFTLISLVLIYPFFTKENYSYLKYAFILGFFYDITFTNVLFLNACLFLVIAYLIRAINIWFSNNAFNVIFISGVVIVIYRILNYFLLIFMTLKKFVLLDLVNSITSSLLINVIYAFIMYLLLDLISKKRKILKID